MTVYPPSQYKFVKFERSKRAGKKYDAILKNKTTADGMVPAYQLDVTFKEVAYVTSNDAANGY